MTDPELNRGCLIPLIQAFVSAIFVGALVWGVSNLAGWGQSGYIALAGGAAVAAGWWWTSIRSWRRYTFDEPEPAAIVAEEPTQPAPAPRVFRLEVKSGATLQFVEFSDCSPDQLRCLAEGVLQGVSFAESAWCGVGRPFSKAQFRVLRDEFLKRQWLRWKNPESVSQGVQLTPAGRAVLRYFASSDIDSPTSETYNPAMW